MSSLKLKEATTKEEMYRIIECAFDAFSDPYEPFMAVIWPIFEPSEAGYRAALQGGVDRVWNRHTKEGHASHWYYVVDEAADHRMCGSANWLYRDKNPFEEPSPEPVATWYPEGDARDFCTMVLRQFAGPRATRMNRPHTQLGGMSVHPDYQRRGIGSMLMQPGIDKTKEMGVDSFIEASKMGHGLYEKFGYRELYRVDVTSEPPDHRKKSNLWRKCENDMLPLSLLVMWKPPNGVYEKGKTVRPFAIPN